MLLQPVHLIIRRNGNVERIGGDPLADNCLWRGQQCDCELTEPLLSKHQVFADAVLGVVSRIGLVREQVGEVVQAYREVRVDLDA